MVNTSSMLADIWTKIGDIFTGFFAIIPQAMYLLYASMASILDMFQFLFRKLVGLDVYYFNGVERDGDLIVDFIEGILGINKEYSALNTVFWSLVVFGIIVLLLSTIFAVLKAQYNYDGAKSSPFAIIRKAIKAVFTLVLVPVCSLLGLYLSQALFKAVDSFTGQSADEYIEEVFENEAIGKLAYGTGPASVKYYSSYDFFGEREWTNTLTFSGVMFDVCGYNANRVRYGAYTPNTESWDNMGIFYSQNAGEDAVETVAEQIDFAFKNSLTLIDSQGVSIKGDEAAAAIASTLSYGPSATFALGLTNVKFFSKYNVGLVWYYYNLWSFNFIIGILGIIICLTLFTNILSGLIIRLFIVSALFLVYPPIVGLTPFDDGNGYKSWRQNFISYLISAYFTVVAMNIMFAILPFFLGISFFNIALLDGILNLFFIIAGLTMVKRFISILTNLVGAKGIDGIGQSAKSQISKSALAGAGLTAGLLGASVGAFRLTNKAVGVVTDKVKKGGYKLADKFSKTKTYEKMKNSKFARAMSKGNEKIDTFIENTGVKFSNAYQKLIDKATPVVAKVKDFAKKPIVKKIAKFSGAYLGIPVDLHDEEDYEDYVDPVTGETKQALKQTEEEKRNNAPRKFKPSHKQMLKNHLLDISRATFKGIGSILGFKSALDKFVSDSNVDFLKGQINDFAQELKGEESKAVFKTSKQKKKEEEAYEEMVEPVDFDFEPDVAKRALNQIDELIKDVALHPDDYKLP